MLDFLRQDRPVHMERFRDIGWISAAWTTTCGPSMSSTSIGRGSCIMQNKILVTGARGFWAAIWSRPCGKEHVAKYSKATGISRMPASIPKVGRVFHLAAGLTFPIAGRSLVRFSRPTCSAW